MCAGCRYRVRAEHHAVSFPRLRMRRRTFVIRAASLLALPAIALAASPVRQVAETTTTIILARHGEKAAEPREDPVLSPAGGARGRALGEAVRGAGMCVM